VRLNWTNTHKNDRKFPKMTNLTSFNYHLTRDQQFYRHESIVMQYVLALKCITITIIRTLQQLKSHGWTKNNFFGLIQVPKLICFKTFNLGFFYQRKKQNKKMFFNHIWPTGCVLCMLALIHVIY